MRAFSATLLVVFSRQRGVRRLDLRDAETKLITSTPVDYSPPSTGEWSCGGDLVCEDPPVRLRVTVYGKADTLHEIRVEQGKELLTDVVGMRTSTEHLDGFPIPLRFKIPEFVK